VTRSASVRPPSSTARRARARAHSTNNVSLSVVRACNGVFDLSRRTHEESPLGASKVASIG